MSTFTLVSLVVWVVFGVVNIRLARKDGRSKLVWFMLTVPFGLLATVFLLIAKAPEPGPARWDSPARCDPRSPCRARSSCCPGSRCWPRTACPAAERRRGS
nr:hypothetical protein GCM10025699_72360 [Microbacterium flavescens]